MIWKKWNVCEPCCTYIPPCEDCPPGQKLLRQRPPTVQVTGLQNRYTATAYTKLITHSYHPTNFCYRVERETWSTYAINNMDSLNRTYLYRPPSNITIERLNELLNADIDIECFPPENYDYLPPIGLGAYEVEEIVTILEKLYSPPDKQNILPNRTITDTLEIFERSYQTVLVPDNGVNEFIVTSFLPHGYTSVTTPPFPRVSTRVFFCCDPTLSGYVGGQCELDDFYTDGQFVHYPEPPIDSTTVVKEGVLCPDDTLYRFTDPATISWRLTYTNDYDVQL